MHFHRKLDVSTINLSAERVKCFQWEPWITDSLIISQITRTESLIISEFKWIRTWLLWTYRKYFNYVDSIVCLCGWTRSNDVRRGRVATCCPNQNNKRPLITQLTWKKVCDILHKIAMHSWLSAYFRNDSRN